MDDLEVFLRLAFFGLAAIMLALTLASLLKVRELKLALAACGFGVFAAEGGVLAGGIFFDSVEELVSVPFLAGANFAALVLLYLSIVKR